MDTSKGFLRADFLKNILHNCQRDINRRLVKSLLNDSKWSLGLKCVEGLQMWPLVDCFSHNYRIVSNSRGNTIVCVCCVCLMSWCHVISACMY